MLKKKIRKKKTKKSGNKATEKNMFDEKKRRSEIIGNTCDKNII